MDTGWDESGWLYYAVESSFWELLAWQLFLFLEMRFEDSYPCWKLKQEICDRVFNDAASQIASQRIISENVLNDTSIGVSLKRIIILRLWVWGCGNGGVRKHWF